MTKVNLVLLLALLVSAFTLVNVRYDSRRVYMALSKAQSQALRRRQITSSCCTSARRRRRCGSSSWLLASCTCGPSIPP